LHDHAKSSLPIINVSVPSLGLLLTPDLRPTFKRMKPAAPVLPLAAPAEPSLYRVPSSMDMAKRRPDALVRGWPWPPRATSSFQRGNLVSPPHSRTPSPRLLRSDGKIKACGPCICFGGSRLRQQDQLNSSRRAQARPNLVF
jgi:hypothetical protein